MRQPIAPLSEAMFARVIPWLVRFCDVGLFFYQRLLLWGIFGSWSDFVDIPVKDRLTPIFRCTLSVFCGWHICIHVPCIMFGGEGRDDLLLCFFREGTSTLECAFGVVCVMVVLSTSLR